MPWRRIQSLCGAYECNDDDRSTIRRKIYRLVSHEKSGFHTQLAALQSATDHTLDMDSQVTNLGILLLRIYRPKWHLRKRMYRQDDKKRVMNVIL